MINKSTKSVINQSSCMKKIIPIIAALIIAAGAGAFYGGMTYAKSKSPVGVRGAGAFANLSPEELQARFGQRGAGGFAGGARSGNGATAGEILSKDDKTITVKLRDGGSKLIILSEATQITKTATGTLEDLAVGAEVTAMGSANSDGSITAESIQLRPPISDAGAPAQP